MSEIVSKPNHGTVLIDKDGKATPDFQLYLDDLQEQLNLNLLGNQVQMRFYTVATLPDASTAAGLIFVTDETGGAVPAFSDGTDWLRVTDRAVVS